jgi:hypothetical protein
MAINQQSSPMIISDRTTIFTDLNRQSIDQQSPSVIKINQLTLCVSGTAQVNERIEAKTKKPL